MSKLVLVFRHGETDWNAEGRFQGHIDVPLNAKGRAQARELIEPLRARRIEAILSSDLARARQTAEIIAEALSVAIHTDAGLREAHLGDAQGLTYTEIEARFGKTIQRWRSSLPTDADVAYPGGESGLEVTTRVFVSLESFLERTPHSVIGISCHGGVIRRIMERVLPKGTPPVHVPNCALFLLAYEVETRNWAFHGRCDEQAD